MNQLQDEVFSAVDRMKQKNQTIAELTSTIDEYKQRENNFKKDISRLNRKLRLLEGGDILSSMENTWTARSQRFLNT